VRTIKVVTTAMARDMKTESMLVKRRRTHKQTIYIGKFSLYQKWKYKYIVTAGLMKTRDASLRFGGQRLEITLMAH
jgi:hypothetical protein